MEEHHQMNVRRIRRKVVDSLLPDVSQSMIDLFKTIFRIGNHRIKIVNEFYYNHRQKNIKMYYKNLILP
jgi:hypothetical protein